MNFYSNVKYVEYTLLVVIGAFTLFSIFSFHIALPTIYLIKTFESSPQKHT